MRKFNFDIRLFMVFLRPETKQETRLLLTLRFFIRAKTTRSIFPCKAA